jgi:hypothetical protein
MLLSVSETLPPKTAIKGAWQSANGTRFATARSQCCKNSAKGRISHCVRRWPSNGLYGLPHLANLLAEPYFRNSTQSFWNYAPSFGLRFIRAHTPLAECLVDCLNLIPKECIFGIPLLYYLAPPDESLSRRLMLFQLLVLHVLRVGG